MVWIISRIPLRSLLCPFGNLFDFIDYIRNYLNGAAHGVGNGQGVLPGVLILTAPAILGFGSFP